MFAELWLQWKSLAWQPLTWVDRNNNPKALKHIGNANGNGNAVDVGAGQSMFVLTVSEKI